MCIPAWTHWARVALTFILVQPSVHDGLLPPTRRCPAGQPRARRSQPAGVGEGCSQVLAPSLPSQSLEEPTQLAVWTHRVHPPSFLSKHAIGPYRLSSRAVFHTKNYPEWLSIEILRLWVSAMPLPTHQVLE